MEQQVSGVPISKIPPYQGRGEAAGLSFGTLGKLE